MMSKVILVVYRPSIIVSVAWCMNLLGWLLLYSFVLVLLSGVYLFDLNGIRKRDIDFGRLP